MNRLRKYLYKGKERTVRAKKHILANFVLKGLSVLIGLILIPITIDYVDNTRYGIWITIQSIVAWFEIFNLGMGNGLRNRFAEALALKDKVLARYIVSTGYILLGVSAIVFFILVIAINQFIDWSIILNINSSYKAELRVLSDIVFFMFFLQLVLKLINSLLLGSQKAALPSLIFVMGNLISLITIKLLTLTTSGNLLFLALALMGGTNLALIIANIYFFNTYFKNYSPKIQYYNRFYVKDIFKVSFQFFGLQLVGLLLYLTSNLMISYFYGPLEVTNYNVSYRYFSILLVIFNIISTPFWSASTEAKVIKDIIWIRKAAKALILVFLGLIFLGLFMLFVSNFVFKLWLGDRVHVTYSVRALTLTFLILFMWNSLFGTLLNGLEALRIQIILGLLSIIVLYLLIFIFNEIGFGIEGILIALSVSQILTGITYPIVYYRKINYLKVHGS
jgi:O-antigen/teichoic acid export membrane protein